MSLDSHFLGGSHWSGLFEELQSVQSCQTSGNAANLKACGNIIAFFHRKLHVFLTLFIFLLTSVGVIFVSWCVLL